MRLLRCALDMCQGNYDALILDVATDHGLTEGALALGACVLRRGGLTGGSVGRSRARPGIGSRADVIKAAEGPASEDAKARWRRTLSLGGWSCSTRGFPGAISCVWWKFNRCGELTAASTQASAWSSRRGELVVRTR
jgi:hypothetical protein